MMEREMYGEWKKWVMMWSKTHYSWKMVKCYGPVSCAGVIRSLMFIDDAYYSYDPTTDCYVAIITFRHWWVYPARNLHVTIWLSKKGIKDNTWHTVLSLTPSIALGPETEAMYCCLKKCEIKKKMNLT